MRWLVAILFIPMAMGQILTDPAGDVEVAVWDNSTGAVGDWGPVDLKSLAIEELSDELLFTVGVESLPNCDGGQCHNAGDLRTYFQYGAMGYYVQQGVSPTGNAYGFLNAVEPGQVDGQRIASGLGAVLDLSAHTVTVRVPRELIIDESGAPPIKNESLTNLLTRSYSQMSIGGQDPTGGGSTDMFVTRDQMGFDAPATFTFAFGGSQTSGPIEISSPATFRASNGGSATYRYDINVTNLDDADITYAVEAKRVPATWSFEAPPDGVFVPAGASRTFPVLVDTLSAHQHGGSETITVIVSGGDAEGRIDVGVHYVTIPQPAGHHPTLFLHSLTDGTVATAATYFGNDDGRIWMNALEDDPGDEKVPIVAQGGIGGTAAQTAKWSICMIPNLRVGIDMDLNRTGELEIQLGSTSPTMGVTVSGRLIHIAGPEPLDFCDPSLWRNRETMAIATMQPSATQDLQADVRSFTMTVLPEAAGNKIPYEPGAQLVLELTATYQGGSPGPTGLSMHPGGELTLPLNEYRDERPAGFLGGSAQSTQVNETVEQDSEPTKESPLPLAITLVALALARRR